MTYKYIFKTTEMKNIQYIYLINEFVYDTVTVISILSFRPNLSRNRSNRSRTVAPHRTLALPNRFFSFKNFTSHTTLESSNSLGFLLKLRFGSLISNSNKFIEEKLKTWLNFLIK